MKWIIAPIEQHLLVEELTPERFIQPTCKGGNELYSFSFHDSPHLMMEVARLREVSMRAAGGGSGEIVDIDSLDTVPNPYRQLIIWNPVYQEIIGGFRYFVGNRVDIELQDNGDAVPSKSVLFSNTFNKKYLPHLVEIDRIFIRPEYGTPSLGDKSMFVFDNLWDGLAAIKTMHPQVKYFQGKLVLCKNYNPVARNIILRFLHVYFSGKEMLATPVNPLKIDLNTPELRSLFLGINFDEDFRFLIQKVRQFGEALPHWFNIIINQSKDLIVLSTSLNDKFEQYEIIVLFKVEEKSSNKESNHIRKVAYQLRKMDYAIPGD